MPKPCFHLSISIAVLAFLSACQKTSAPSSSFEVALRGVQAGALSPGGENAFIASINHGGSLWRTQDGERLFNWNHSEGELSTIIAADFDPTNKWTLSAEHHTLVLWDNVSGKALRFWTAPGQILDAKLGPNANFALLGLDDHSAVLFDVRRGGILRSLAHQNRVRSVDISDDGKIAITGSEDYHARTWNLRSGKIIFTQTHKDDVQLVRLSADGRLALSASKYDKAIVWHSETGEIAGELPLKAEYLKRGLRFTAARFSDDNKYLLTGRPDQQVELWDLQNFTRIDGWQLPKRKKWKPTSAAVMAVAFSSRDENEFIAIASNGFVHTLQRNKQKSP